jgi:HK97 gp10 family phage protein
MRVEWNPEVITAQAEKFIMDRLEVAGEQIAADARQRVPVKSGKLKDSIRVTRLKGDPKLNIRVYAGNRLKDGPFYAHMVEYGTVKMTARPFLRPALNAIKGKLESIIGGV